MKDPSDKFCSNYVTIVRTQCIDCEHRDEKDIVRCLAYPTGIPKEILLNEVDHTKPYVGDHGIQFKRKVSQ
jgi:hypothetical protein